MRFYIFLGAFLIAYTINPSRLNELTFLLVFAAIAALAWDIYETEMNKKRL